MKGIHNGISGIGGSHGIALHICSRIELADDIVPCRLGSQPQIIHELDELALAVTSRRLGLFCLDALP